MNESASNRKKSHYGSQLIFFFGRKLKPHTVAKLRLRLSLMGKAPFARLPSCLLPMQALQDLVPPRTLLSSSVPSKGKKVIGMYAFFVFKMKVEADYSRLLYFITLRCFYSGAPATSRPRLVKNAPMYQVEEWTF